MTYYLKYLKIGNMVALGEFLKIKVGPQQPKPLCEMTDSALSEVIRRNAALRTKYSNFPFSQEFLAADAAYHNARRVFDERHGEYMIYLP